MKKIFTLFCSTMIGTLAFGQMVPNGDFEGGATAWLGTNTNIVNSVTINKQGGGTEQLMPVGGKNLAILQNTTTTATLVQKFAFTQRPNSFRFMFCYLPAGAGELGASFVRLTKYNTTTMKVDTLINAGVVINAASYPWKEAILDLSDKYKMAGNPDTAYIVFYSSVSATRLQGTSLVLDNVKFSANSASIQDVVNANNVLVGKPKVSPNPVKDNATINYQVNTACDVKIELFDMTGKLIKEIANEKKANFGNYTANLNVENITPGVYFYKVTAGTYTATEKIVISK